MDIGIHKIFIEKRRFINILVISSTLILKIFPSDLFIIFSTSLLS